MDENAIASALLACQPTLYSSVYYASLADLAAHGSLWARPTRERLLKLAVERGEVDGNFCVIVAPRGDGWSASISYGVTCSSE